MLSQLACSMLPQEFALSVELRRRKS